MKTTIFYTVTFRAFLLANSSMAMSKFIIFPLLLYRQCGKISQSQGARTRSYAFLISFSFEKRFSQVATLTAIVRKICSIITIFGTEFQRLYLWINCKSSRGPFFPTVNCTSATSYNCVPTKTFSIA